MSIVQKSRAVGLSIGIIAAFGVFVPMAASAATLYVSDFGAGSIKQISPTGTVTTFATGLNNPYGLAFAPSSSSSTAVPEPFTIIGTLIGGTAALRMRKKLKSSGKV